MAYNAFGDPLTVEAPLGGTTTTVYDENRNVVSVEDPNTNTTAYVYDAADQLVEVTRPDSTTLEYGYDLNGNRASYTDGAGHTTTYAYGDPALPAAATSVTDPLARTTGYSFDRAGRPTAMAAPGGSCGGSPSGCTTYSYDGAGQMTSIGYSEAGTPDVTEIVYDDLGRRVEMTDSASTVLTWAYDSLGRMTSSGDGTDTTSYGHDLAGNVTTIAYPGSSHTVTRGYDDAGRQISSTDWNANAAGFDYDPDGRPVEVLYPGGGQADSFAYDPAGRMDTVTMTAGAATLAAIDYTRDPAGQLTGEDQTGLPGPDRTWGYDDLDRLTDQDATPTWAYDDADNLTETSPGEVQVFDDANQLCSTAPTAGTCVTPAGGATVFDYDDRGNRVEADPASGPTVNYGYDQADRLTQHDDATTTWTYTYRPDGLRASADDGVDTTGFTWDQTGGLAMLLTETTGTDRTHYLYGPGGLPYAEIAPGGAVTYLHHDQLGSTRLQTNTSAAVTGTVTYDAYGTPAASTGTLSRLGYAGQYTDPTGLQYLRTRYYDPTTGQFLTRDALQRATGEAYGYASNTPLNATDPSGLACAFWSDDCDLQPVADLAGGVVDGLGLGHGDLLLGALGVRGNVNWNSNEASVGQIAGLAMLAPLGASARSAQLLTYASQASSFATAAQACYQALDARCLAQALIGASNLALSRVPLRELSPVMAAYASLMTNLASMFVDLIAQLDGRSCP